MKRNLFLCIILLIALTIFVGCDKDKNETEFLNFSETTVSTSETEKIKNDGANTERGYGPLIPIQTH